MSMEVEQLKVILPSESIVEETEASNWYKNIRKVLGALAGQARRVFIKYWCSERTEEDKTLIHWVLTLSWPRTNHSLTPRPLDQWEQGSGGPLGLASQASLEVSQPQARITTSTGQLVVEAVWNYWGWDTRQRVSSTTLVGPLSQGWLVSVPNQTQKW